MSLIAIDFDGTITQMDTINVLAHYAVTRHDGGRAAARQAWETILAEYVADHGRHLATYEPKAVDRTTLSQELEYLESLRPVEQASAERVAASELFRGLGDLDLERFGVEAARRGRPGIDSGLDDGTAAHDMVLPRKGFAEFIVEMGKRRPDWGLGLVSINWSRAFVEGVLKAVGVDDGKFNKRINTVRFGDGSIVRPSEMGCGGATAPLMTARDKAMALANMMEQQEAQRCVYIGDSVTDISCLLESSLGIVVADGPLTQLLKTLDRLGFDVPHVYEWKDGMKLAWARDFDEILQSELLR